MLLARRWLHSSPGAPGRPPDLPVFRFKPTPGEWDSLLRAAKRRNTEIVGALARRQSEVVACRSCLNHWPTFVEQVARLKARQDADRAAERARMRDEIEARNKRHEAARVQPKQIRLQPALKTRDAGESSASRWMPGRHLCHLSCEPVSSDLARTTRRVTPMLERSEETLPFGAALCWWPVSLARRSSAPCDRWQPPSSRRSRRGQRRAPGGHSAASWQPPCGPTACPT